MIQRERKIDISKMTQAEVAVLEQQLGGRIREICDKACEDANRLLNVYGMAAKMQIVIDSPELKKTPVDAIAAPKKRGRPRKMTQSLS
jgi:hypothetical protein